MDSASERNTVEVYSVDDKGRQKFVAVINVIPAYAVNTPDKAIVRLEERPAGMPQAIHKWFYPGDNYGWEFVYPKSETLVAVDVTPAAPPSPAAEPSIPDPPQEALPAETASLPEVLEEAPVEPVKVSVLLTEEEVYVQGSADRMLPETAGHSMTDLVVGLTMLGLGAFVLVGVRKAQA
jgi:hypothetical protein